MSHLTGKRRPKREKISDPLAHGEQYGQGPFRVLAERDPWGDLARHYTAAGDFRQAGGVLWYNNCGPTAVTNLLTMVRQRSLGLPDGPEVGRTLYSQTARYGVRHLFFRNARTGWFHGTSDLRAGAYIRRTAFRLLHLRLKVRLRRATGENLRRSIDQGALLYLLLWNHPEYRFHHVVGYGYTLLESQTTGEKTLYIKTCDGHAPAPRYLAQEDFQGRLRFYYEVRVPDRTI